MMLDFPLSMSPASKTKVACLTNGYVLYPHMLSDEDMKWCIQTRAAIATYLEQQGSANEGDMYSHMVVTILSRAEN